jgi:hypothetical protein
VKISIEILDLNETECLSRNIEFKNEINKLSEIFPDNLKDSNPTAGVYMFYKYNLSNLKLFKTKNERCNDSEKDKMLHRVLAFKDYLK